MIKRLYELGYFEYQKFILENSKKLSLSCEEAMVLIRILDKFKGNKRIDINDMSENLNMTIDKIQNTLSSLIEKGIYEIFITYDCGLGEETITLDGFFNKCEAIIDNKIEISHDDMFLITKLISSKVNRILTSQELDIISSLVTEDKYNINDFESAISKLQKGNKVVTIKGIAQALSKKEKPAVDDTGAPEFLKNFMKSIK